MLLEHLGEAAAAQSLMAAIEKVTANPALHTRDLGGLATTDQVTAAVCQHLNTATASAESPPVLHGTAKTLSGDKS